MRAHRPAAAALAFLVAACVGRPCCPPELCAGSVVGSLDGLAPGSVDSVRVEVAVVRDVDAVLANLERVTGPWAVSAGVEVDHARPVVRSGSIAAEAWHAALAGHVMADLAFDAISGRSVGARKTTITSYVQDYDVELSGMGSSTTSVLLGALEEGLTASVLWGDSSVDSSVSCDVAWSELKRPMPKFTTSLADGSVTPVTLELPEIEFRRSILRLLLHAGAGALSDHVVISEHAGRVGLCARIAALGSPRASRAPSLPIADPQRAPSAPDRLLIEARVRRRVADGPWLTELLQDGPVPGTDAWSFESGEDEFGFDRLLGRKPSEMVGPADPGYPLPHPRMSLGIGPAGGAGATRDLDVTFDLVLMEGEPRVMPTFGGGSVKLPTLVRAHLPLRFTLKEGQEGVESTVLHRAAGDETWELSLTWKVARTRDRPAGSVPKGRRSDEGIAPR